jgi:sugar/nucleoside kinase (ribokinase family)
MAVVDPKSNAAEHDWHAILKNILPEVDLFSPSVDDLTSSFGLRGALSDDELQSWNARFIDYGVAVSVISAGRRGLFASTADRQRFSLGGAALVTLDEGWHSRVSEQRSIPVDKIVSTNGAGDAATAGLLYGMWMRQPIEDALRSAVICAAEKVRGRRLQQAAVYSDHPDIGSTASAWPSTFN